MDPRIWSALPDHLLEHILSFLPLQKFLSLRSTCKHFNSLIVSPSFVSKHSLSSSSSSFSSFILLSHPQFPQNVPLFNTSTNSWSNISLSLPPNLISSSNGLLCFSTPRSSSFMICNPLVRSLCRVNFPKVPFEPKMITLISTSHGYKLFTLSSSTRSSNNALIYDSTVRTWQESDGFDPIITENPCQKCVFYKGFLFFTTRDPFYIVRFHLETGKWERLVTGLPEGLTFARLVSNGASQKLYLVGGIGISGISKNIKIWELTEDGKDWVEIETLPQMMRRKFVSVCYHNYEHVYCFWQEGLICVCCYTWPEILFYKVCRRTWHWLPKCPLLPEKWSCGFQWFAFRPQLYPAV